MKLRPLTQAAAASYPELKAGRASHAGRWARRLGAVACAAAVCGFTGCRTAGSIDAPEFEDEYYCTGVSSSMDALATSGIFEGELCAGASVTGSLEVVESTALLVSLSTWGGTAAVDVVDPDGVTLATATPGFPVEVAAEPGQWELEVVPDNNLDVSFTLTISASPPGA